MNDSRRDRTALRMMRLAALVLGISLGWAELVRAEDPPAGPSSQLWLISTRFVGGCGPEGAADRLSYWVLGEDAQFSAASVEQFLATDNPAVPTIIFLHGNRVGWQESVNRGWLVYQLVASQAAGRPFRFVIWSWPADQIRGPLKDARAKAARSDVEAFYLAALINRVHPHVPLSLIGYSFGARSVTGALDLLAGGQIAGTELPERTESPQRRIRAMLVAAAVDAHWILPGNRHGAALSQVEQVFLTVNPTDQALKRYQWLYRGRYNPRALGWAGPACPGRLGPWLAKLEMVNVACEVGKKHDFFRYIRSGAVVSRLGWYGFLSEPVPNPAGQEQPVGPALAAGSE